MRTQRDLRIRNRTILILLLPAALFLFAVGWLLNSLGDRKQTHSPRRKQTSTKNEALQIHIATAEEPEQYND